jgi:hypothetical protein
MNRFMASASRDAQPNQPVPFVELSSFSPPDILSTFEVFHLPQVQDPTLNIESQEPYYPYSDRPKWLLG